MPMQAVLFCMEILPEAEGFGVGALMYSWHWIHLAQLAVKCLQPSLVIYYCLEYAHEVYSWLWIHLAHYCAKYSHLSHPSHLLFNMHSCLTTLLSVVDFICDKGFQC